MKNTIITIIMGMFLISYISGITIEPEVLEPISMYSGETFTEDLTIKTDGNYLIYLNYEIINNTYNDIGFYINLPTFIFVEQEKIFEVEISTNPLYKPDKFIINFTASTQGVKANNNSSINYDNSTGPINTRIGLELEIDSTGNGTVEVISFTENPSTGFSIPALNKFFYIEVSKEIEEGMNETILKVFYTQAEVNSLGIDENNLRLHFYNETTQTWILINSWVDTTNNIVYGITDHFSLWGVFAEPTPEGYTGGGGSRRIYIQNKTIVEVDKYIDRVREVQGDCIDDCSVDDITIGTTDKEPESNDGWKLLLWTFGGIFIIIIIVLFIKSKGGKQKMEEDTQQIEKEETTEENEETVDEE